MKDEENCWSPRSSATGVGFFLWFHRVLCLMHVLDLLAERKATNGYQMILIQKITFVCLRLVFCFLPW